MIRIVVALTGFWEPVHRRREQPRREPRGEPDRAALVPAADDVAVTALERVEQIGQEARRLLHVDIQRADVGAARRAVAGRRRDVLAEVATEHHAAGERELVAHRLEQLWRVVGAAVVDEDDLQITRELVVAEVAPEHRRHLDAEVAGERAVVVDRDDERVQHQWAASAQGRA
jgi:hypothetical protein